LRRIVMSNAHGGFGLLESLVALAVVSVGMMGIAALYGHGLRAETTALYQTVAVNLAADMADRLRANRRGGEVSPWRAQVAAQLPAGDGSVAQAGTEPPTYTITVNWAEPGAGPAAYVMTVRVLDE
jgi:type IV pilus assembly protein PilV